MKTRGKIFYGWYIVLAGFVIMGVDIGIFSNCASQFIKPIAEDLGLPRASVSVMQTITSITHMCVAFMAGKIFTRKDLGRIMKIDCFVACGAYFCYSLCKSIYALYGVSLIFGISMALLNTTAFSVIILSLIHISSMTLPMASAPMDMEAMTAAKVTE